MRQVANPSPLISINSHFIKKLRQQKWDQRRIAFSANQLAFQTRKPSLVL